MAQDSNHEDNKTLGIRIEGQLYDFQIVEDNSDCDDDKTVVNTIPSNLMKASNTPSVYGDVAITNSEHVIIGSTTTFNGPVTIKQVIHSGSGLENASYEKTEDEDKQTAEYVQESKGESSIKSFQIKKWHKIVILVVCIIVLGGIFAILSIIISYKSQDAISSNNLTDDNTSASKTNPLIIAPDHLRIVSRTDWLAQPVETQLQKIRQPVPWVIISHTATESCSTQSECVLRVRLIQMYHIESRNWSDIGYNFLVAGDGSAYFGRGWDYVGAHTLGYNKYSIGISFVGTFNNDPPPKKQIDACIKLLKRGVALGKLAKDYKLFAHRQLASTLSPGDKLYDIIKEWPHFVKNFTDVSELFPKY